MTRRPNIVFVMTDHTSAEVLRPASRCLTPTLDALAQEGYRFQRCYTTNAICSPARASLMTGTYPSTHGVWDCTHTQRREWINLHPRLPHWAQRLAQHGYATGYFGKWHVEQSNDLAAFGWQESIPRLESWRAPRVPGSAVTVPRAGYKDYVLCATADDSAGPPHHPAFDAGIDFIGRHAADAQPFCCFVSTSEPHDPYVPPLSFLARYDLDSVPLSPTLHDDLHGKPEVLRRMQSVWAGLSEQDWRRVTAAHRAVVTFLDSEVGRLLAAVRRHGLEDRTIVVFTSDHGDMLGAHGLAAKGVGTAYEEVYNIPLILRVPGLPGGVEEADACTSLVDLGPTLLDLAAAGVLPEAQGRSLRPVLEGTADTAAWQDAYAEFYGQRFVYTQRLVWHGPWKFIFSPGGIDELYNLRDDPRETANRAADPACRPVLEALCARMWRRMREIGDDSLFNTHYATLRTAAVGPLAADAGGAGS